jgi:hypothetical protein
MPHDPDEREFFRLLADDARRGHLEPPEELRRRSDRRTATRAVLGTVAVVVAVGGVIVGGGVLGGSAAPEPPVLDTASPTATEPTTTAATPAPTEEPSTTPAEGPTPSETVEAPPASIPQEAWLDKADLRIGSFDTPFEVFSLCGRPLMSGGLADSEAVLAKGTRDGNYQQAATPEFSTPDGTTRQTIVLMDSARAAEDLMASVDARVAACPEESTLEDPSQVTYSLADPALPSSLAQPDRHVLIDVSRSYEPYWEIAPEGVDRFDTFVSVVQVGDVVSFLEVRGWEASDTSPQEVRLLAGLAVKRLADWRR